MSHQENLNLCRISAHFSPKSNSGSTTQGSQARRATVTFNGACSNSSSLLQERLRERNAERRKSIQSGDGATPGSPIRSALIHEEIRPSSSGLSAKGMGVKQWEEQTSTLHKQNYNLKLELYHRRDRQSKLEAELAAAHKIINEQAQYQKMNEMLLYELDRRDQAVDEAINLIICLEEQIDLLREENHRLSRTHNENICETESNESLSIRQQRASLSPPMPKKTFQPRPLPRVPSFLSENSEGTEALRSLYTKYTVPSESALSKLNEEDDEGAPETIDSPRLSSISRLSESSFISVYGNKNAQDNNSQEQDSRHINSSVLNWVEEAPSPRTEVPWTPLRKTSHNSNDVVKSKFLSPNQASSLIRKNLIVNTRPLKRIHPDLSRIEDRHTLPPTPDTFCTGKLRVDSRNSNYTLNQQDKGLINYSSPSEVSLSDRPQSACETITSRRGDHDWDSSSEMDEGSISRTTEEQSFHDSHLGRVKTPVLFTFNESEWDRDTAYYQEQSLPYPYDPALTAADVCEAKFQCTSMTRPCLGPQNDILNIDSRLTEVHEKEFQSTSQAATEAPDNIANLSESLATSNLSPVWKRNPISLTLARFRRSDHSSTGINSPAGRPKAASKVQSLFSDRSNANRDATPTILLQRDVTPSFRPVSADGGLNPQQNGVKELSAVKALERQRQVSACNPGTLPQKEVQFTEREREEENSGGKSVRKWLGLSAGRSNSLKKN